MSAQETWYPHTENDKLGTMKQQGENLANFIKTHALEGKEPSITIGLEATWGCGKTFFCQGFAAKMRDEKNGNGHLTIFFNAWQNSFVEDPLEALIFALLQEAKEHGHSPEYKSGVGALLNMLTSEVVVEAAVKQIIPLPGAGTIANKTIKAIKGGLKEYNASNPLQKFEAQRKVHTGLQEIVTKVVQSACSETNKPVIFIIDELDRCPPDYAMKVLERIRHIMDATGTVFILAYDRAQMADFIAHQQGTSETRKYEYFERFVDFRWPMLVPNTTIYTRYLMTEKLSLNQSQFGAFLQKMPTTDYFNNYLECFVDTISQRKELTSLRSLNGFTQMLASTLASVETFTAQEKDTFFLTLAPTFTLLILLARHCGNNPTVIPPTLQKIAGIMEEHVYISGDGDTPNGIINGSTKYAIFLLFFGYINKTQQGSIALKTIDLKNYLAAGPHMINNQITPQGIAFHIINKIGDCTENKTRNKNHDAKKWQKIIQIIDQNYTAFAAAEAEEENATAA